MGEYSPLERISNGIFKENVIFVQVLAMCPTLAVTTSAINGIGMGAASTAVLIGSNVVISLLRKFIPEKVRIPAFIIVIAGFVTLLQFIMQGMMPDLYAALGIFIPLIVVNCVILGRAEAFASKNGVLISAFDGLGQGIGFTIALIILGAVREILGVGQIFGFDIFPNGFQPAIIMVLAPGAFISLGILMAIINFYNTKKKKKNKRISEFSGCDGNCAACSSKSISA